jgi:hypothetical protein
MGPRRSAGEGERIVQVYDPHLRIAPEIVIEHFADASDQLLDVEDTLKRILTQGGIDAPGCIQELRDIVQDLCRVRRKLQTSRATAHVALCGVSR